MPKHPVFTYSKSFFYKLWLFICILILIATTASSFLIYIQISGQLKDHIKQRLLWEANYYRQQIDEEFLKAAQKLDSLATSSAAASANRKLSQNEMVEMRLHLPALIHSWIAYPNGTLITAPYTRPEYVRNLPWWREYLAGKPPQSSTGYLLEQSQSIVGKPFIEEGLTAFVPLISLHLEGIKIIRAAGALLELNSALTDHAKIEINWSTIPVSVYTNEGILIASPYRYYRGNLHLLNKPSKHPLILQMLADPHKTSGFKIYHYENQKMAGVFLKDPDLGLVLSVEYPTSKIVDPQSRLALGPLIIAVSLLLIAGLLITMIYTHTKRLRHIEQLARSAELRALQAQINPHFLFNTLDCIVGLAVATQDKLLVKMLRSLIHIFRYTTREMGELVTLQEELKYLDEYVSLQLTRFGSRVSFIVSIPDELLTVKIFKFCIQPLVENCFIHAVEKTLDPISITVSAKRINNTLEISIIDNGPGMSKERLSEIRQNLMQETYESGSQGHGLGISNIHHRIKYTYGSRYGLRFQLLNPGLAVYIDFPIIE